MASRKITELTALTTPASGDVLPIIDISESLPENQNKKITIPNLTTQLSAATTSAAGIVQLNNTVASTSTTQAATANAVKTTYDLAAGKSALTLGTAQASTSDTVIDFTGLPSGVKRITVIFEGVSQSLGSDLLVQLGDSGGFETTGYLGRGANISTAPAVAITDSTAGFPIRSGTGTNLFNGHMLLTNISGNLWVASYQGNVNSAAMGVGGGSKTLSATLDRVRITTIGGIDTFDAGSINLLYEV